MKISILNKAIEESKKSKQRFGFGAVIFKGGRIFGSGYNEKRSSNIPIQYKKFPFSFHAEMAAVHDVSDWKKIKGASILVVRLNKSGNFCDSYPCKYCIETLKHVGIKWVYFSNKFGEIKRSKL